MKLQVLISGIALVLPLVAFAQTTPPNTSPLVVGDRAFLYQLAQEDMSEIKLAKLAIQKSANPQVQSYARSVLANDPAMGYEAKIIAVQKHVTIPDVVNVDQKSRFDRLSELSGADFDRAYMQYEAQKQQQDLQLVQQAADTAQDQDVKNYAINETALVLRTAQAAKSTASSLQPTAQGDVQPR